MGLTSSIRARCGRGGRPREPPVILVGSQPRGCHGEPLLRADQMRLPGWYCQCASCRRRRAAYQAPHRRRGVRVLAPGALVFSDEEVRFRVAEFRRRGFYNCCSAADAEWALRNCVPSPLPANGAAAHHCGRIRLCTKVLSWFPRCSRVAVVVSRKMSEAAAAK